MAKNRKNQSGAIRFVPALKTILLCLLIGGSAIGYVLQKNKLHDLGRQIAKREEQLHRLKQDNKLRASQLAGLQLPQKLAERVKELRLGLSQPMPGQVLWLPEPVAERQTNHPQALLVMQPLPRRSNAAKQ